MVYPISLSTIQSNLFKKKGICLPKQRFQSFSLPSAVHLTGAPQRPLRKLHRHFESSPPSSTALALAGCPHHTWDFPRSLLIHRIRPLQRHSPDSDWTSRSTEDVDGSRRGRRRSTGWRPGRRGHRAVGLARRCCRPRSRGHPR